MDPITVSAFVDELQSIQKEAVGGLGSVVKGFRRWVRKSPLQNINAMRSGWRAGVRRVGNPEQYPALKQVWGGIKGVASTTPAQALGVALPLGSAAVAGGSHFLHQPTQGSY